MDKVEIIKRTANFVRETLAGEGTGHDWWHIERVRVLAKRIAKEENANEFVVELGALLHDIADYKFNSGDEYIGGRVSEKWLRSQNVDQVTIDEIVHIVNNVSFKGGKEKNTMRSNEGKIVQDADRLDAIGAIGIARCFAFGGFRGNELHNPNIKPNLNMSKEQYKKGDGTQINHFYEKLLLLKDRMNTETGKKLAQKRHKYMEEYLAEFFAEWDAKA